MQKYLYRCEVCKAVICVDEDHGRIYYVDCCGTCQGWAYYEKIVIVPDPTKLYDMMAYCPTSEECKKDGNSNTGTNQKT